ncbi:AraC family transcriptional regulator [Leptospira langatensis]|uniref:AraC family transcriptional regulator n=1 Tax=Leptospira langatensis TaxID=2484983 RepID=A0A5F1ZQK7_9LEPT|nr:helix-turn-helix domain-containing protein [Leptospira langatensis]TGK05174.1 AraC family transcriptional regulator [Leptospira langatensis]TGL38310.1 AraC family transcriptional regulator [Leptospira langatensis]
MDWIHSILLGFIEFSTGAAFLYSILEISRKSPANRTLVIILLLTGAILMRYRWYLQGDLLEIPYLFFFLYTSIVLVGPLLYTYIDSYLQEPEAGNIEKPKKTFFRKYWYHFLIVLIFGIFEVIFFSQEPNKLRSEVLAGTSTFRLDLVHIATFIACLQVSFYSLLCLHLYHQVSRSYEIYELKLIWLILLLPVVANILIGSAFFLKDRLGFELGTSLIGAAVILLFVVRERHPGFFQEITEVIENSKYQNTPLLDSEIRSAGEKIKDLLEKQYIYRDSELRLVDLAAGLGLNLHQTSRYLNEVHKMNFYELINKYRVEEACKLLTGEPERSVLDIGFSVGFNSKSTFNSQFVKAKGLSPALYRKKNLPA